MCGLVLFFQSNEIFDQLSKFFLFLKLDFFFKKKGFIRSYASST